MAETEERVLLPGDSVRQNNYRSGAPTYEPEEKHEAVYEEPPSERVIYDEPPEVSLHEIISCVIYASLLLTFRLRVLLLM